MKRILAGSALLLGVTLPAVVLDGMLPAHAATAPSVARSAGAVTSRAPAGPTVVLPARVVVRGAKVKLTGSVTAPPAASKTASAAAMQALSLWFTYPGSTTPVKIGGVSADSKGMLTVTAKLDAARIAMGLNTIQIRDGATSSASTASAGTATATVDVRRRSRVKVVNVVFKPTTAGFATAVAVKVSHFDPKSSAYIDSRLSPVTVQELVDGAWVTRAGATTNTTGQATATFASTAGRHTYRAVRPNGATVWSAISPEVTVRTPVPGVA